MHCLYNPSSLICPHIWRGIAQLHANHVGVDKLEITSFNPFPPKKSLAPWGVSLPPSLLKCLYMLRGITQLLANHLGDDKLEDKTLSNMNQTPKKPENQNKQTLNKTVLTFLLTYNRQIICEYNEVPTKIFERF